MVSQKRQLVNDNAVLRAHPMYSLYHKSLHNISLKDYPNDCYFRADIDGIDLDQYEIDRTIGNRDMTMDAIVGIADYINNRTVNNRLLLVELRMDYDSTKHLRHSKLQGKIAHSRFEVGASVRVDEESVFVFRNDVSEQAKKWMFNTSKEYKEVEQWVAMSPEELNNMLLPISSIPYQVETDMTEADSNMTKLISDKDFESLLEFVIYWNDKAEGFKRQFKLKEEAHIKQHLHDVWQLTTAAGYLLNAEQKAYVEVIEDEYKYLR